MHRVLIYRDTGNLGDAMQTYALCRLLGRTMGVYRDGPHQGDGSGPPFVVNGWLGWGAPPPWRDCIFAGVHLGKHEAAYAKWIRAGVQPAGARDSYSAGLLGSAGIETVHVGCATLTLERYRGRRKGRYSIDIGPVAGTETLTQNIGRLPWKKQWELAAARLALLRRAEIVYTNRIHVILPCLAFGTPVYFPMACLEGIFEKQRLTLLADLGFPFDAEVTMDVTAAAAAYCRFLERAIGQAPRQRRTPTMPEAR